MRKYLPKNIVLDTVMVSTSGHKLLSDNAIDALTNQLFPIADIVTPNIPEAEVLSGMSINNAADMETAARTIFKKYGTPVLIKGGHRINDSNDFLISDTICRWYTTDRIDNPNTHGTGCTLSSAIAANLALGYDIETSVTNAKEYISNALRAMLDLGKGSGPLMHNFN